MAAVAAQGFCGLQSRAREALLLPHTELGRINCLNNGHKSPVLNWLQLIYVAYFFLICLPVVVTRDAQIPLSL